MLDTIKEGASDVHRVRLKVEDYPISLEELSVLRAALIESGTRNVDIVSTAKPVQEDIQLSEMTTDELAQVNETVTSDNHRRLEYLRRPNLSGAEKILMYIGDIYENPDITLEEVQELTAPLNGN